MFLFRCTNPIIIIIIIITITEHFHTAKGRRHPPAQPGLVVLLLLSVSPSQSALPPTAPQVTAAAHQGLRCEGDCVSIQTGTKKELL